MVAIITCDFVPAQIWQIVSQPADGHHVRAASMETSVFSLATVSSFGISSMSFHFLSDLFADKLQFDKR